MGWSYVGTARIEPVWGQWRALLTFSLDTPARTESLFAHFAAQPTQTDADAAGAALAGRLNADGAAQELAEAIANDTTPTLIYQTRAQLAQLFRQTYQSASQETAARMATWLLDRISAGDFTDAQVQAAFGLSATQYSALKTRLGNLRTQWLAVQAAQGE